MTEATSTRPYLIRALYEWCTDNGFTPYVAVAVDASVQVPMEHVKNNEIVLNVGFEATSSLNLGNEFIHFKARFGGVSREILIPIDRVIAIYARENGQGMAFPMGAQTQSESSASPAPTSLAPVPTLTATPLVAVTASPQNATDNNVVQLIPGDDDDNDPPKPSSGKRPSLKRVK